MRALIAEGVRAGRVTEVEPSGDEPDAQPESSYAELQTMRITSHQRGDGGVKNDCLRSNSFAKVATEGLPRKVMTTRCVCGFLGVGSKPPCSCTARGMGQVAGSAIS